MTRNNIPRDVMQGALAEVYRVTEALFLALGGRIPAGCSFARSIDSLAERCYDAAAVAYYNEMCKMIEGACGQ